jgi:small-conductance mechanosensitive channel
MIAGFTILTDRPFRPGDRVRLATGESGDVLEVGIRSTRIRLLDHNLLVVPNADLTNSRIVNCNQPTELGAGSVELRVAFGADLARVERVLCEIAEAEPAVAKEPAPSVSLRRFGDAGPELLLNFSVARFSDATLAEDRIRREIHRRFASEQIVMPPPAREIRIRERA